MTYSIHFDSGSNIYFQKCVDLPHLILSGLRLTWCGRFCDLKQDGPCLHVADLEPGEVDHVDVFLWGTQVV